MNMNKTPKFLMMLATAGLAFSMAAHAEDNPNQTQSYNNQTPNAAVESAKDLLGKTFSFGKSAFSAVVNSEPAQQVKGAVVSTGSAVYNSEGAQKIKGVASDAYNSAPVQQVKGAVVSTGSAVYNSEGAQKIKGVASDAYHSAPVQSIKTGAGNVISAGKDKVNDMAQGVTEYKQNALAARGVNENSSEEEKKAAYGEANGEAVKSFFGNLLNKTKAVTNEVATTVQNATAPTDQIGEIAKSEKVQNAVVASPEQAMKNVQSIRTKDKAPSQKPKYQNN
jgi:hypothetical protein